MSESRRSLVAAGLTLATIAVVLVLRALLVADAAEVLASERIGDTTHHTGSWHFPRGGPYVLGFESQSPATLFVDDEMVARGQGIQKKRIVYQAGDYRVRVETAGPFRLLWHPPGRRGPLEYVPASSLSPDANTPRFHRPGTSLGDGLCALVIVLALLACIAYLGRHTLRACDRRLLYGTLGIFAAALALRWIGLDAQGQTWDEDVNWSAGRNYVSNLLSLDFSESSWRWNYEHPPVMKYLAGIGAQFSDGYSVSRAISALLVSLACALLVPIGRRLFSLRVGILAGAFAALTPHIIAHSKVVGHEAPTMLLWTLAIWLSLRAHDESEDPYRLHKRFAVLGVVLGLAVFSRYINGLLAPLIGAIVLVQAPREERAKTVALGMAIIPLAAAVTCFLVWPRMWTDPILHIQESWDKLKKPHGLEPYLGVMTDAPGRSYFFVYLWATAPLGVLLFAKAWLARAAVRRERSALVLGVWLLVPMLVSFSPVRQDGVRYIMPSLLALNMAAAAGVDFLVQVANRCTAGSLRRSLFPLVSGTLCVYLVFVCHRIHPFYLDYYGEQVGGARSVAASKRFEIAWWGEGMNQALDYLNEHAPEGARVYKRCFEPGHLAWMRGDLWPSEARNPRTAEWFLVYQPTVRSCPVPSDATLVFEATAQGAPLARVYRRRLHP